jgi:hypothetical protein
MTPSFQTARKMLTKSANRFILHGACEARTRDHP